MPTFRTTARERLSYAAPLVILAAAAGVGAVWLWRRLDAPRWEVTDSHHALDSSAHTDPAYDPQSDAHDVHGKGTGPLFHRRYAVDLPDITLDAPALFLLMQRRIEELAPDALAAFEKTVGDNTARLKKDDEFDIAMLGPWSGTVRVSEVGRTHFTLVTLKGHPEAGHITFRVESGEGATSHEPVRAVIESWARSRDALVQFTYDTLGVGKQLQTEVWVTFLQRLSEMAGGSDAPEVHIVNETDDE